MTTRPEMRQMIRRRLADTGVDPLWEDAFLDDAIAEGIRRYSTHLPRQESVSLAVTSGDREVMVPGGVNGMRIVRVFDDQGNLWQRWAGGMPLPVPTGPDGGEMIWRTWGTTLLLDTAAPRSGYWRIEHLTPRTTPANDTDALDVQPGDDDLIIALALAIALDRRAIADGKRFTGKSGMHPLAVAARTARIDADRLVWERMRHIRST